MPFLRPMISVPSRRVLWLLVLPGLAVLMVASSPVWSAPPVSTAAGVALNYGVLPLSFVPNAGQTEPAVRFQAHTLGAIVFFTPDEVVLSLPVQDQSPIPLSPRPSFVGRPSSVVRLRFEDANTTPQIAGANRLPGVINYFIGNDPARWQTNLPTYGGIVYFGLYPGVDLHYRGTTEADVGSFVLKGSYTVAPGADPTRIHWRYQGVRGVQVDEATGDLRIDFPARSPIPDSGSLMTERAPIAWQDINGRRVLVDVRYDVAADGVTVGFALGDYDTAYPLVIDPSLTYSTYVGGGGYDYGRDIAVDGEGNAYIVGSTTSTDFPTLNPIQPNVGGGPLGDAFVVKLNSTGSALVYATYLGGSHNDSAYGVAVDSQGQAYVTGDTLSADFPTANAAQPTSGGGGPFEGDAFVAKLGPTGSALVYSTYLGGGGEELSYGIALDTSGNAYVAGYTSSTNFPTVNAPQPDPAFGQGLSVYGDAFVTKVVGASGVYTWGLSTYLGGTDLDMAREIALDATGSAYVTGQTRSDDFPTARSAQPDYAGGSNFGAGDAFVTQILSASGVYTWGYSTYLGGSGDDAGNGIAVNSSGDAYVTGETLSSDFPTENPLQDTSRGDRDLFLTKVVANGGSAAWGYSTYLGGVDDDIGRDVTVDAHGRAHLTGNSFSPDFPTSDDAYDVSCGTDGLCDGSGSDVIFTVLNSAGDGLDYSTFLGGSSSDFGHGIALDTAGDVYLTGYTYSADFPTSAAAYDRTCGSDAVCNGSRPDAFVAKFIVYPDLSLTKSADPPGGTSLTQGDTIAYTVVAANHGAEASGIFIADAIPPGTAYVPGSLTSTLGSPNFDGAQVTVDVPSFATGVALTATFQVTVTTGFTAFITNQATLTGVGIEPHDSNLVGHPVRGTGESRIAYLPLVLKGATQTPPSSACAPYPVATIGVGDKPRGIALDTRRDRAYVANYGSDSLSVIDTGSNSVIETITGIVTPNGVAYDTTHDLVWVSNYEADQVTPVDASSLARLSPVTAGDGPWGVAYDPIHDRVYVANSLADSVTVIEAGTHETTTLSGDFDQPFHLAANPVTGKTYVTNFGNHSLTVVAGASVTRIVDLSGSPQPYGVAVDETRDLIYVATVSSHQVAVIGTDSGGTADQLLGLAAFYRGFGDPARPVPLRVIAANPDVGPTGDGGHLWLTTATADGGELDQVLLVPKGWDGYFSYPAAYDLDANPSEGIAVDRATDRVYVSSGTTPGIVSVLGDNADACLVPFGAANDGFGLEVVTR